ncbi:MAG: FAD-binding oxidoreductase [Burkholderiales bacterium]|jgi:FAD/FMN-containing dehydrogenase|nr:FAD-binding oxidoreductase [Burkholderiales bacterium]MBP7520868.1 FAD-binding oxidoreductase [Leptothrix sp. (in: b-proteobacteria)]
MQSSDLLTSLRHLLGEAHVLQEGNLDAYLLDWRKRWQGRALAVVRPADTAQVAQVVKLCRAAGVSIVPQGGNTGLVGGGVPDASGRQILLSTRRLQRVRSIDAANLTMTVEAGCVLQSAQAAAESAGLLLPLSLAAEGSCTVGGNLATNAGGTQVLRYGNARELCLGLEVVTTDGEVWNGLAGLRKDNTGYDLRHLFIGSEGTLGIITAAVMRLYPRPKSRLTALASTATLEQAVALLQIAQRHADATLTGFEVMNRFSLELVRRHFPQLPQPLAPAPWTALLELSDSQDAAAARHRFEGMLQEALEVGCIDDAAVAESIAQSQAMWHLRESISLAQAEEGLNIKHDISVPVSRIPEFVRRADAALDASHPGARLVNFGHLGDGNLHYNVQCPVEGDAATFLRQEEETINHIVFDAVAHCGGSFSAEHGIGALKRDELQLRKSPVALGLMRSIKSALDPDGLFNPGRML